MERNDKKLGGPLLYVYFGDWKERNQRALEDLEQFEQAIICSFTNTFLEWVRLYVDDHSLTIIGFVDWLSS